MSVDEDFDDISLFVSGSGSSSLRSFSLHTTDSSYTLSGQQEDQVSPEDAEDTLENDTQQVCFSFRRVWNSFFKKIKLNYIKLEILLMLEPFVCRPLGGAALTLIGTGAHTLTIF